MIPQVPAALAGVSDRRPGDQPLDLAGNVAHLVVLGVPADIDRLVLMAGRGASRKATKARAISLQWISGRHGEPSLMMRMSLRATAGRRRLLTAQVDAQHRRVPMRGRVAQIGGGRNSCRPTVQCPVRRRSSTRHKQKPGSADRPRRADGRRSCHRSSSSTTRGKRGAPAAFALRAEAMESRAFGARVLFGSSGPSSSWRSRPGASRNQSLRGPRRRQADVARGLAMRLRRRRRSGPSDSDRAAGDLVSGFLEQPHQVGADITAVPSDKDSHGKVPLLSFNGFAPAGADAGRRRI